MKFFVRAHKGPRYRHGEQTSEVGRGSLPHMRQTALAAVMAAAKQAPLPDAGRRGDVSEAKGLAARTVAAYGAVHQQIPMPCHSGGMKMVEVLSAWPMFCLACLISAGLAQFVADKFDELGGATMDSPCGIVLYADEVDPGDPLIGKHARKY